MGFFADGEAAFLFARWQHHRRHGETVSAGEIQIALVAGRATEDCAGAVIHQHEIGDPDRETGALDEGMFDSQAGVDAALFGGFNRRFAGAHAAAFGDEFGDGGVGFRQGGGELMLGGDGEEGHAKQRVRAGGVNRNIADAGERFCERELQFGAFAAADPIALHLAHAGGPAVEGFETIEQFLRKIGDAQEPLRQLLFFHQRARAPAAAVDHLFIGKHGVVDRIPIDPGFAAIDQAGFDEIQEQGLLQPVIAGVTGGKFA